MGIPTVADRIAQTVVKMYLEPDVEPQFHPDSYGYRPRKSAIDALTTTRQRCWRYDWVIDLDIRGFFDNLDHALVMRAVRKYTRCRWILLYVQRWLTAPMQQEDLKRLKERLRARMHEDVHDTAQWLGKVVNGWLNYYAVPTSAQTLCGFIGRLEWIWLTTLRRRSQKTRTTIAHVRRLATVYWPSVRVRHPWPDTRFAVNHPR